MAKELACFDFVLSLFVSVCEARNKGIGQQQEGKRGGIRHRQTATDKERDRDVEREKGRQRETERCRERERTTERDREM